MNMISDGDCTASPGSPSQYLTTLSVEKFLLVSNLDPHRHSLRQCPLVLSLVAREKRPPWRVHSTLEAAARSSPGQAVQCRPMNRTERPGDE